MTAKYLDVLVVLSPLPTSPPSVPFSGEKASPPRESFLHALKRGNPTPQPAARLKPAGALHVGETPGLPRKQAAAATGTKGRRHWLLAGEREGGRSLSSALRGPRTRRRSRRAGRAAPVGEPEGGAGRGSAGSSFPLGGGGGAATAAAAAAASAASASLPPPPGPAAGAPGPALPLAPRGSRSGRRLPPPRPFHPPSLARIPAGRFMSAEVRQAPPLLLLPLPGLPPGALRSCRRIFPSATTTRRGPRYGASPGGLFASEDKKSSRLREM
ncbi:Hypothetical predicted protein [Podarcis lilfordi]|uniref:Uncharacterized protein n=1 Tax=Podarcis lilfordi TaxID=74358 RepID=A0AA35PCQ7_9SAUR|nr:Hypothetical predicted protein [Podarcis lilfordi]